MYPNPKHDPTIISTHPLCKRAVLIGQHPPPVLGINLLPGALGPPDKVLALEIHARGHETSVVTRDPWKTKTNAKMYSVQLLKTIHNSRQ